jgi:hypothetical protein
MALVKRTSLLVGCLGVLTFSGPAQADPTNHFISNGGTAAYLLLGLGLPLLQDGANGGNHSLRELDSLISSGLLAEGLKQITHEKRPNSNGHDSFPSEHTTAAFAMATMQAQFHPSEAPFWYAGAAVIGYSRIALKEHHWGDVLAGAALGWGTARLELSSHRGLLISPFFSDDGAGVQLSMKF